MAAISKEPINKSFIDIICNCSNKNSSAVSCQQTGNDRQTFRNQYKSADAQAYLRLFLLYLFKVTHEGV